MFTARGLFLPIQRKGRDNLHAALFSISLIPRRHLFYRRVTNFDKAKLVLFAFSESPLINLEGNAKNRDSLREEIVFMVNNKSIDIRMSEIYEQVALGNIYKI